MSRRDEFIELREQGFTLEEIAADHGITRQRAHQIITGYKSPSYKEVNRRYLERKQAAP